MQNTFKLPKLAEILIKDDKNEKLTMLEAFIYANEPRSKGAKKWRELLFKGIQEQRQQAINDLV